MKIRGGCRIREFEPGDAPGLLKLFEQCDWGPCRDAIPFTGDDLERGFEENGFVAVFVAVTPAGEIVGVSTLGAVSVQRASRPGGVMGDHLVVHPGYRIGPVSGHLMHAVGSAAAAAGYARFDAAVETDNKVASAIYRRLGFRRIDAEPCEDGCYLYENYVMSVVPYLLDAGFARTELADALSNPRHLFQVLRPGRRGIRGPDATEWRGTTVVEYELAAERRSVVSLLVDRTSSAVVAVRSDQFEIEVWPDRRRTVVGQPNELRLRVHNLGNGPRQFHLSGGLFAAAGATAELGAGEETVIARPWPSDTVGQVIEEVVVTVDRDAHHPSLRFPLRAWHDIRCASTPAASRDNEFVDDGGGWTATQDQMTVAIDGATGALTIQRAGRVVALESWPDVGPPFPGAYLGPIPRAITRTDEARSGGTLVLRSAANGWLDLHPRLAERAAHRAVGRLVVERRFTLLDNGVLRIDTAIVDEGEEPTGGRWLRTWPRVLLNNPRLVVAGDAPVGGRLPRSTTNFEFVRSPDMASDPATYEEPWSAFEDGNEVVGLVFPGSTEVRFGSRWMPSVLYDVPATGDGESTLDLPPYLIVAANGGKERVARAWTEHLAPAAAPPVPVGR
jgi:hypothetical protein